MIASNLTEAKDEIISLREINADLLKALKSIKAESDTIDRTAHESLGIIHIVAREAIRKYEEQMR